MGNIIKGVKPPRKEEGQIYGTFRTGEFAGNQGDYSTVGAHFHRGYQALPIGVATSIFTIGVRDKDNRERSDKEGFKWVI